MATKRFLVDVDVDGNVTVNDEAYGAGWNGSNEVPTKNAIYDKIETLGGSHGNHTGHVTSVGLATTLVVAAITGQTATTTLTGTDEFLVNDGGAIRRVDMNRFIAGLASELTTGLAASDEFAISDGGVIKRMALSVLEQYMRDYMLANNGDYILLNDSPSDDKGIGIVIKLTNSALGQPGLGDVVELSTAGEAIAASASSATRVAIGISINAGGGGGTCECLIYGAYTDTAWDWLEGEQIYVSTGGNLTQTPPSTSTYKVQVMGIALSTDTILVNPSVDVIKLK